MLKGLIIGLLKSDPYNLTYDQAFELYVAALKKHKVSDLYFIIKRDDQND